MLHCYDNRLQQIGFRFGLDFKHFQLGNYLLAIQLDCTRYALNNQSIQQDDLGFCFRGAAVVVVVDDGLELLLDVLPVLLRKWAGLVHTLSISISIYDPILYLHYTIQ